MNADTDRVPVEPPTLFDPNRPSPGVWPPPTAAATPPHEPRSAVTIAVVLSTIVLAFMWGFVWCVANLNLTYCSFGLPGPHGVDVAGPRVWLLVAGAVWMSPSLLGHLVARGHGRSSRWTLWLAASIAACTALAAWRFAPWELCLA